MYSNRVLGTEKKSAWDTFSGCFTSVLLMFVGSIFQAIVEAWAISTLWNWFVTRLGVSPINYALAFGLGLVVSVFTTRDYARQEYEGGTQAVFWTRVAGYILAYILAVFIGWIALHFI